MYQIELLYHFQDYLKKFYNLTEKTHLPEKTHVPEGIAFAKQPDSTDRRAVNPLTEKLKEMQKFFGLKVTGRLNTKTLSLMKKPRCGVPDAKVARFSTFGDNLKWTKNPITYR